MSTPDKQDSFGKIWKIYKILITENERHLPATTSSRAWGWFDYINSSTYYKRFTWVFPVQKTFYFYSTAFQGEILLFYTTLYLYTILYVTFLFLLFPSFPPSFSSLISPFSYMFTSFFPILSCFLPPFPSFFPVSFFPSSLSSKGLQKSISLKLRICSHSSSKLNLNWTN